MRSSFFTKNKVFTGTFILALAAGIFPALAQNGVKIAAASGTAHASAMLDVESTTKGMLVPRMTAAQRGAIAGPATGLIVYQTDAPAGYYYYNGSAWAIIGGGVPGGLNTNVQFNNSGTFGGDNNLVWDNTNKKLGIGNTAPQHPLSVGAATSDGQLVSIRGYSNAPASWKGGGAFGYTSATVIMGELGGVAQLGGHNANLTAWANLAINSGGGNVGIGTSTPGYKLEVGGDIKSTGNYIINNGSPTIYFQDNDQRTGMIHMNSNLMYFLSGTATNSLGWTTNGSYWPLTIDMTNDVFTFGGAAYFMEGNVGIGTSSPGAKLQISGGDASYTLYGPNTTWGAYLYVGAGNNTISSGRAQVISTNGNLHLDAGSGQSIYLANYNGSNTFINPGGGSVGIGTTSPGFKLHVPSGYIGTDYFNSTDNVVSSGVTGVMVKTGDNYFRTATAGALATFMGGSGFIPNNGSGDWQIASSSTSTNYSAGSLELRESNFTNNGSATPPHLGFHWGGVVASNIAIESSGRIAIRDNPGTGYENFIARHVQTTGDLRVDGVMTCLQGQCPPNSAVRMTPNFHFNNPAGYAMIVNWDNGGVGGGTQQFRVGNGSGTDQFYVRADGQFFGRHFADLDDAGYYINPNGNSQTSSIYNNAWFRAQGQSGFYFQDYGGGWQMTDATWIRAYNSKPILATGGLGGYGNAAFGGPYGGSPRIYANYDNVGTGGIAIADDGGFYDFNDGWIEFRGSTGLSTRSDNQSWDMIFRMTNATGGGIYDKRVATESNNWGLLGASGNAWYQVWGYSHVNASSRSIKKDITPVTGSLGDLVMADLDKLNPYLYRYNCEMDDLVEGKEAKYRPGLRMGLILDETPDYIQDQSYNGVDIYAVASLGVVAGKHNREEIKQIKQSIGLSDETMMVHDFGSTKMSGTEMFVSFNSDFSAKLGNEIPAITVTSNVPGITLSITEKNARGFKIVSSSAQQVSFDYIAIAKVKNTLAEKKEAISPEVMKRLSVSDDIKAKVKKYWDDEPAKQKALEAKAFEDAKAITAQRAKEIGIQKGDPAKENEMIKPDVSPEPFNDPAKAPGYNRVEERVVKPVMETAPMVVPVQQGAPEAEPKQDNK